MTASDSDSDLPALLGGRPLFPGGPAVWPPDDRAVREVLQQLGVDGTWGRYFGPHCEQLIERLREFYACEHVLLCSSGRAAVELALRGLQVATQDEVALAAYDFHSNFSGIQQVGARPVLMDVRPDDAQLDVSEVEQAISPATKAIIGSHLHGGAVDMPGLCDVAKQHDVAVIEDACQASGATVYGRPAGMWGDVGVLSFGGSKLLTAGRGGALLTNRVDVMQRIRLHLRGDNHAYPLSEMQAAVLVPQLVSLPERHQQRAATVAAIDAVLTQDLGLRRFAVRDNQTSPGFYKVGFFYDAAAFAGLPREQFIAALQAEGLAIDAGFDALQQTNSSRRYRAAGDLENATTAGETVVALHHPVLLESAIDWTQLRIALERIRAHAPQLASRPY